MARNGGNRGGGHEGELCADGAVPQLDCAGGFENACDKLTDQTCPSCHCQFPGFNIALRRCGMLHWGKMSRGCLCEVTLLYYLYPPVNPYIYLHTYLPLLMLYCHRISELLPKATSLTLAPWSSKLPQDHNLRVSSSREAGRRGLVLGCDWAGAGM